MVASVSNSAVSGSTEPSLMSVAPPMVLGMPQTRFCGCAASSVVLKTRFRQVAIGFWLAGTMLTSVSWGLTPTAWGPIRGATFEPRVRVAVTCARPQRTVRVAPARCAGLNETALRSQSSTRQAGRKRGLPVALACTRSVMTPQATGDAKSA